MIPLNCSSQVGAKKSILVLVVSRFPSESKKRTAPFDFSVGGTSVACVSEEEEDATNLHVHFEFQFHLDCLRCITL